MTPFLQQLAKQLIENHKNDLNNVCIILPNHRAILYLKKYLSELIDKPTWSPQILSIDDFVFETTHLQKCDNVEILFELYSIHCNIANKEDARIFDDFIQWGNMILSDFEEIDAYMVDAEKLFQYLSEEKAIELWNVEGMPLTQREQNYITFYQSLSIYYNLLKEKVLNENKAWSQLAFRVFNDKFDDYFKVYNNKHFYIAGFNALTTSEKSLIKKISLNAPTEIFWDYDEYYLDKKNEAGAFLRENFKSFGNPKNQSEQSFKENKTIHCYALSNDVGQAIETCKIIQENDFNPDETAIILNDESLLMQILNFLPDAFTQLNITMGYSFKNTQLYECLTCFLDLHASLLKNDKKYYYKNLFSFLQHPVFKSFINTMYQNSYKTLEYNIKQFAKGNSPFLSIEDISETIFKDIQDVYEALKVLLIHWDGNLKNAIYALDFFVKNLIKCYEQENDLLNLEYLLQVQKNINKIEGFVMKYPDMQSGIKSISFIFKQIFSYISIPFSGEPLGGLQIMGLLESRLLDFKNIIMVSVNEGVIPKNAIQKTFIPFNIRKIFGLPTISEQNSITAYHFYRTIQRSENIHLLYNCQETSGVGFSEKSRFITQLELELPKYNDKIQFFNHSESLTKASFEPLYAPVIQKDEKVIAALDEKAKQGFSPSAINTYNDCTLKFYFNYILKIKTKEELAEDIDSAILGTIIHKTIEVLHSRYVNCILTEEIINLIINEVEPKLIESFQEKLVKGNYKTGYNYLLFHAAKKYILNFLNKEKEYVKDNYVILSQEVNLHRYLELTINETTKTVLIKGFADRISSDDNFISIVDFKSGSVEEADAKIQDFNAYIDTKYNTKQKSIAFQLLTYSWLYSNNNQKSKPVESVIIALQKNANKLPLRINKSENITTEILDGFEELLRKIFTEMYDTTIPFKATDDHKKCDFCDFSELCKWKSPKNQSISED